MFSLNNTFTYGLRLLVNLHYNGDKPKQLKKIAQEENISLQYLRKLVISLERAGIVKGLRGPGGGFLLSKSSGEISLLAVNNALNRSKVIDCLRGRSGCRRFERCLVKDLLEEVYDKVRTVFKDKTLDTVVNPTGALRRKEKNNKISNRVKKGT